jgi:chromosome segregation ATPase
VQENCSRVIAQHNKLASNLQVELQRHEHEADNLQIAVDNETVEEGRLETLKKALISAEDEKNRLERMYEDAVMDRDRHDPKLAGIKRCLDDIDVEIKSIVDEHKRAQTALNKKVDERHQALVHKNQACEREASLKARQIQVQAVRNETSDTAADWKMKATTVGARVHIDPSETSSSIEQKLEKLASDILNVEARLVGFLSYLHITDTMQSWRQ